MLSTKHWFSVWALLVMAALMFVYCGSDDSTEPVDPLAGAALCLSDSSCALGAICDTSSAINVTNCGNATSLSWSAESDAAWLTLSVCIGETPGQFCLVADSNRTGAERTATVTVTADDLTDESIDIAVTQPSLGPTLHVSLAEWEAYCLGEESGAISVTNCGNDVPFDWTATEEADWLELSVSTGSTPGSFIITADANHGESPRTGTVTVTAGGVPGLPWEITVEQPPIMAFAGTYGTPDFARDVFVSGGYAYVADIEGGLQIVDVSDPTDPGLAGEYVTTQDAYDIFVQDNLAFLATDCGGGVRVFDVSDPADPDPAAKIADCTPCVFAHGDYAYMVDGVSSLFYVIDVSDLSDPRLEGSCMVPPGLSDLYVLGDYVYMACNSSGLRVIDISNPSHPVVVGICDEISYALRVHVVGDYAYVADRDVGLQIVDVSDPSDAHVAQEIALAFGTKGVFVSGNYLYATTTDGSLLICDITDPTDPVFVEVATWGGQAEGVYVDGGYAYVAIGDDGLLIIELGLRMD